jgi:lysophospholipase L1-like esterase
MSALFALAFMQAATARTCVGGLCDVDRLAPFVAKLEKVRQSRRPVRIIQIGDSHTAGDQVTGTWRALLQARFGGGGRGVLPPGRPYQGYLTRGISARQSAGWTVDGLFGLAYHGAGGAPIGLTGYSLSTASPGASMSLQSDQAQKFDRFTACAMRGPGAGTLAMTVGTTTVSWALADDRVRPDCKMVETDAATATATLTVVQGPVTLTSWATEQRGEGGVILSNLGTVGAQLVHFERTDEAVVARELKEYDPDLIVMAFGTNEAFRPGFTAAGNDAALRAGIRRIRRLAPGVPILLIGAPDSATRLASLQVGEGGMSPACAPPVAAIPLATTVQPLPAGDGSAWRPTAALAAVQSIARAGAHDLGLAYWDWSGQMGGRCTADNWTRRVPPLMRGDHVHFTTLGASVIAGLLERDIEAAMVLPMTSDADEPR